VARRQRSMSSTGKGAPPAPANPERRKVGARQVTRRQHPGIAGRRDRRRRRFYVTAWRAARRLCSGWKRSGITVLPRAGKWNEQPLDEANRRGWKGANGEEKTSPSGARRPDVLRAAHCGDKATMRVLDCLGKSGGAAAEQQCCGILRARLSAGRQLPLPRRPAAGP